MEGRTKEKLLYILERLRKTDEQHPVNTNDLIAYLTEKALPPKENLLQEISKLFARPDIPLFFVMNLSAVII